MNPDLPDCKPTSRAWLTVGLLWIAGGLYCIDRIAITTVHQSLVGSIHLTEAQFGLQISVYYWFYGLLNPVAGYVADRSSRSRVILFSLFGWSVVTLLTAFAHNLHELLATRVLLAFAQGCYYPAAGALIADYHRGSTRSFATGLHVTGLTVGGSLAGLGGWLAERHGWNYAFLLFGAAGLAYCLVLLVGLRDAPRDPSTAATEAGPDAHAGFGQAVRSLFSSGPFLLAFFFWGLLGVVMGVVVGWMPTYVQEHFHLSEGAAGFTATGYLQTAALVGVLGGGAWADRWSRTNRRARILVPVIGLCLAAPGIVLLANTQALLFAIVGLVLYGCTRSFTDSNLMPILCLIVDERYRATAFGFLDAFSCLLSGAAIYLGGALRDAHVGLTQVLDVSAVSMVVCALLLFLVRPRPALG